MQGVLQSFSQQIFLLLADGPVYLDMHKSHYGIIYHVDHPCLLLSYKAIVNITIQIIYIKGTT